MDCPICDQGGECDLQDEALGYGRDDSRYLENKRAVEEKFMGPLIKTVMTRCIQCTRCIRFVTEIGGVSEIGMIGRGEDAEITTYLEKAVTSELSGNLVDVCPVGALTSKPYAFNARPWELTKTESIDVMDAVGSAIRIDARGPEVLRVLPRVNEEINEEWISDKTRHACDGLSRQRLDRPYVRVGGKLKEATWAEAFAAVAAKIKAAAPDRIGVIAGDLQDAESMKAAMDLFTALGSPNIDCRQDGSALHPKYGRESYLFNTTIAGIEDADAIMIIGSNPRKEAAMVNARIRKRWLASPVLLGVIGEQADLNYQYNYLGAGADSLAKFAEHGPIQKEKPMFIVGAGAVTGEAGAAVLALAAKSARSMGLVKDGWNGWNVLHTAASRVGGLDMGFVPGDGGKTAVEMVGKGALDVLFLLGADEIDLSASDAFTVYLGSHGDRGAAKADVILPGAAYTEKSGIYVNTEGAGAARQPRRLPQGTGEGGLGHPARAVRATRPHTALRFPRATPRQADGRSLRPSGRWTMWLGMRRRRSWTFKAPRLKSAKTGKPSDGAAEKRGGRLLHDQPDRAGQRGDGRMLGAPRQARSDGGGVGYDRLAEWREPGRLDHPDRAADPRRHRRHPGVAGLPAAGRPQDLGGRATPQRPQCGRSRSA